MADYLCAMNKSSHSCMRQQQQQQEEEKADKDDAEPEIMRGESGEINQKKQGIQNRSRGPKT